MRQELSGQRLTKSVCYRDISKPLFVLGHHRFGVLKLLFMVLYYFSAAYLCMSDAMEFSQKSNTEECLMGILMKRFQPWIFYTTLLCSLLHVDISVAQASAAIPIITSSVIEAA